MTRYDATKFLERCKVYANRTRRQAWLHDVFELGDRVAWHQRDYR